MRSAVERAVPGTFSLAGDDDHATVVLARQLRDEDAAVHVRKAKREQHDLRLELGFAPQSSVSRATPRDVPSQSTEAALQRDSYCFLGLDQQDAQRGTNACERSHQVLFPEKGKTRLDNV